MRKKIIYGCEERGDTFSPYLTRYTLFECSKFQICIHIFHRSDGIDHHDHPWDFISLILWRGYYEETPVWPKCSNCKSSLHLFGSYYECMICRGTLILPHEVPTKQKRVWPGMLLFRKATHRHRVVLVNEKKAITLVIMGKRIREWGFFTRRGFINWKRYFFEKQC